MSLRKEVFQAKVLQRLYPAAPKTHDVQDSPSSNGKSTKPPGGVRHQPNDGSGVSVSNAGECRLVRRRKVYTALPRPDDYRPPSTDGSVPQAAVTGSSGPHSQDDGRPALN
ncbi:uncharacterized protein LOC143507640, partial [Brachyhypopomus gauderio]|uniref:uncharacterized protein LOC143507640 n=1 Tax=Brachyhypopomus gauderio TaxID=698409 RepID=UPI0040425168